MKKSVYKTYGEPPLFLNAETAAKVLGSLFTSWDQVEGQLSSALTAIAILTGPSKGVRNI